MSFRLTRILYGLINLIIALFFVATGIVCFLLPWFEGVQNALVRFITENTIMIFLFGFGFIVIGFAVIAHLIASARPRYYRLKGGPQAVTISESLFQDYLTHYWKQIFPSHEIPCQVQLEKEHIRIIADLPHIALEQQKKLLEQIQQDITEIFTRMLGYRTEYILAISFRNEENPKS